MDDFKNEHALETFRSLVTIAVAALQSLVLLNGGALVALLAYIGQIDDRAAFAGRVAFPVASFILGLVMASMAFFSAYVTQLLLYGESALGAKRSHQPAIWVTLGLAVISLGAFAVGSFCGATALTQ
ncbi:MAG TPA: hypothetical protein VK641_10250 [Terriglobales bacterium]|nr:hypothetical protein [Terriglobales bacterium]